MLPHGVRLAPLLAHHDPRGSLTELYRDEWLEKRAIQWNFVRSEARVLRGVHVHLVHADYLVLLGGGMLVGMRDLRRASPTFGATAMVALSGEAASSLAIPPGVAHGFYFPRASTHLYSVTAYWDPADELGCHWADPALGLAWPDREPLISERDASLGTLDDLMASLS